MFKKSPDFPKVEYELSIGKGPEFHSRVAQFSTNASSFQSTQGEVQDMGHMIMDPQKFCMVSHRRWLILTLGCGANMQETMWEMLKKMGNPNADKTHRHPS